MMMHPRDYHLLAPLSEPDVCNHGRPDHQVLIRELAEAMGLDLPALSATPAQVWAGLIAHAKALTERDPWASREGWFDAPKTVYPGSDARAVTIGDAGASSATRAQVGQASRSGSGGVTPGDESS